jgi:hypothetical protein
MSIFKTIAKALTFNNCDINSLKSQLKKNSSEIDKLKKTSLFVIDSEVFGYQDLSGGFGMQNILSESATLALLKCSSPSQLKSFIETPRTYTLSTTSEYFDIGDNKSIYFTSCSEVRGYFMPYGTVSILNLNFTVSTSNYDDVTVVLRIFTDGDSFTESRVEFLNIENDLYNYATKQDLDNRSYKYVRYEELIVLRNKSQLIPGQQYRITNYKTSTSQSNTQSANHRFDLIVTATSKNTLHHKAKAVINANDSYYDNSKLEAWEIWYDIDNDTSKYAWATPSVVKIFDTVSSQLYPIEYCSNADVGFETSGVVVGKVITSDSRTLYCKVLYGNSNFLVDSEDNNVNLRWEYETEGTGVIYRMIDEFGNDCPYDFKNIQFKRCKVTSDLEGADLTTLAQEYVGYSLSGYGASMPLHISLVDESDYKYVYTFSCVNNGSIVDASLGANGIACYDNSMKPYIASNVQYLNDIVMYAHPESGNHCITKNTFASDCFSMTLGCEQAGEIWDNHFGQYCKNNIILGPYVYQTDFGANLTACYFSQQVSQNNIGSYMQRNFVNNTFVQNVLGPNCKDNIFMKKCSLNTIGEQFMNNTCNDEFYQNNLGAGFLENTFNGKFYSNVSYNQFMRNTINGQCSCCDFGTQCTGNTLGIFRNSKVGSLFMSNVMCDTMACVFGIGFNCNNVTATKMQCSTFGTYVMYNNWTASGSVKNIKVSDNLQGTTSNYNNIELPVDSLCEIKVSRNSAGDIKIYCAADFDKQIEDAITTVINTEIQ